MKTEKKNRWYDAYPDFSRALEWLKGLEKRDRDKAILDMKDMIMDYDDELIDRHVFQFPLTQKRRWYDKDPYSWLVINALKYAEKELLDRVTAYLKAVSD